jgi:NADPH-dependent F420 reductase
MKVTIVGAGNMGRGIGTRLVAGGNDVELVDRDPAEARALAEELQAAAKRGASATALEPDSPFGGEVVVLALYYPSLAEAVAQYADRLAGKVVVEISNPIDFTTFDGLVTPPDSSAAEEVARLVPEGTPVVKAFNTTFGRTLESGEAGGEQLDVFVAGDDPDAKRKVIALVEAGGLRPIDAGPLRRARQLEHLGFLHIVLQEPLGAGFGSALKLHW